VQRIDHPRGNGMKLHRRHLLKFIALASAAPALPARASAWPTKPVRLVAGGIGGVTDIRARWLAPRLAQALGQPVVVENNAAAGGNVSAADTARGAADGYTVLVYHQGIAAINPHLYAKPGYDALRDLAGVTRWGRGPLMLTVPAALPAQNVNELLALARDKPGTLNFGSPGIGTPPHIASELFVRMAGIQATHVPYRGGGALLAAVLAGQITWSMDGPTAQLPHVRSGTLRALAVTGLRRLPAAPEVATIAESGVPGYEYEGWVGLAVAAGTPRAIVERLHAEVARIAATAEAREWFAAAGAEAGILEPAEMDDLVKREHARFGRLIQEAGLKIE
jgi:tripartite-type tricarboxylate transporter receptor subunit TctC